MMERLLFSFSVSPLNPAVNLMLIRVVKLILGQVFHIDSTNSLVCRNEDDAGNRIGVFLSLRSSRDNSNEKVIVLQLIEHGFLGVLQEILTHGAAGVAWSNALLHSYHSDIACPGIVHLHGQRFLRSITGDCMTGSTLTIYDHGKHAVQRIEVAQPLGLYSSGMYGVFAGQIREVCAIGKRERAIRLGSGNGLRRTLLLNRGVDTSDLIGRSAVVFATPVRGRIYFRAEVMTFPQRELF